MRVELKRVKLQFFYEDDAGIEMFSEIFISGRLWDDAADRATVIKMAELAAEREVQRLINQPEDVERLRNSYYRPDS
jgi:hypothetical protein